MAEMSLVPQGSGNPYKIVDHARERRKGITASSLEELTNTARSRLALPDDGQLTIVLEQDGEFLIFFFPDFNTSNFFFLIS